jgi:methylated-DNA-[protein]-cysteine S-methyltransferase
VDESRCFAAFPGHALFVTRIGACGLAWNASAICAVQLPEASWGETRERMLLGLTKRHALQPQRGPAVYGAVTSISAAPGFAVQAMAGVQCLLAGVNSQSEQGWANPAQRLRLLACWAICGRPSRRSRATACPICRDCTR